MGPLLRFRLAVFTVARPIIRNVLLEICTKRFDECSERKFWYARCLDFLRRGCRRLGF
ncbi:hypothetical protein Plhal304r1_c033g0105251 [Plasmopara halstedii]